MKERTINGLLTLYDNCQNIDNKISLICRGCILNNKFYGHQYITICEMIEKFELTNHILLEIGI